MQNLKNDDKNVEIATLGGGCFWCLDAVYRQVNGLISVVSGYSGGHVSNPSDSQVYTGTTGHVEVVQVTFDPEVISFKQVLEIFFVIHDSTQLNRQGNDVGTQYRSAIFYHSHEQEEVSKEMIQELTQKSVDELPIVTDVEKFDRFYPAEEYHQNYFEKNPGQGYCQVIITPKLSKFKEHFKQYLKKN